MAVLKCTVCGGELDVNSDLSVGKCQYCGSTITIPKELDRKGHLYNRAVFLRQNNEFDKASEAYENLLREDNSDADAHWGLVLSKFGIEYVADPRTGERMPTCHRTQAESILGDPDYLAALEYSCGEARDVIEKDAKRINDIQTRIIEISRREPPYDVFICYKESDDTGNRTEDSILAQDLYYELSKKGYRVFFARKTLESRLGLEYEPIIYAALSSAKVMIVLGTKPEHFNAVWVRNEWSRFCKMAVKGSRVVIPAYRGMSPYELPAELSVFQSQDMSKIGFMQDLTDGIERCLCSGRKTSTVSAAEMTVSAPSGMMPLDRLIKNGETYLKLNNYPSAEEVYTTVTKEYPEDYRGWWGLMVCRTESFSKVLPDQSQLNVWFGYVKQLANQEAFAKLENTYVDYTRKVSSLAAENDVDEVGRLISKHKKKIDDIEQVIWKDSDNIKKRTDAFKTQEATDDKAIREERKHLKAEKADHIGTAFMALVGIGMAIGGFLLWEEHPIWGLLCITFGGGLGTGFIGVFFGQNKVPECQMRLRQLESDKPLHKDQFKKDISQFNIQIAVHKEEVEYIQNKIKDCQRYLNLGNEKIAAFWFAQKCAAFGVDQPLDQQTSEYREAAFAPVGQPPTAEKRLEITIVCPACGSRHTISKSEAWATKNIVCEHCGSRIDIKNNIDGGKSAPPVFWVCSACGWACEGEEQPEYCPVCGASGDQLKRSEQL